MQRKALVAELLVVGLWIGYGSFSVYRLGLLRWKTSIKCTNVPLNVASRSSIRSLTSHGAFNASSWSIQMEPFLMF